MEGSEKGKIDVFVSGDFAPINRTGRLVEGGKAHEIYNDVLDEIVKCQVRVTNLECPLIDEDSPIDKTGPHLRAGRNMIEALLAGSFNLVTLANNHILDHGAKGLLSTMQECENNEIACVGAGLDLDSARKPYFYRGNGASIAILNCCENEFSAASAQSAGANPLDLPDLSRDIKKARQNADYIILIIHGGHEYYHLPSPRIKKLYRFFIEMGVDAVISHHTHCYSGYERYLNGLIFYGLGNFVFDMPHKSSAWTEGYAVNLAFDLQTGVSFKIIPFDQSGAVAGLRLLEGDKLNAFERRLHSLNEIIGDDTALLKEWNTFVERSRFNYLMNILPFDNLYLRYLYFRLFPLSKKRKLLMQNLVRCESHHDALLHSLLR